MDGGVEASGERGDKPSTPERKLTGRRLGEVSSGEREVEIEGDIHIASGVVSGKSWEVIDVEERALSRVVHRTIAARFDDADILDRAIAVDGKADGGLGAAGNANAGIDGVLHPVLIDIAAYGLDIPGVPSSEIAAALALNRDSTV